MQEMRVTRRGFLAGAANLAFLPAMRMLTGCSDVQAIDSYLERHAVSLHLDWEDGAFPLENMDKYRVFLAGESHGFAKNYEAKRALVASLHEQMGMSHVLLEYGVGAGMLLDRYLETGDEDVLDVFVQQTQGTAAGCQEEIDFWHWLREYNLGFEESRRIHVHGVDIDHQTYLALWTLRHIVTLDAAVSEPVAAFAQTLSKELDEHDPAESPRALFESQTFAALDELLQGHQADARACFENDYEMVELLVRGHRALREYYMLPESEQNLTDMRDEYMARVFDVLDRSSQGRVYFGQFGSAHVQGAPTGDYANAEGYASFAMRLAGEDSTACGSVCSLLYAYYDGERDVFRSISGDFQKRLSPWQGEDVLIDLAAPNSPFDNAVEVFENGDVSASTCYQQLVLLSNMNMVTPLPQ